MKFLLTIPAILFATHAAAECGVTRPAEAPEVPSGVTASKLEMYEAQKATQAYVDQVAEFLKCREKAMSTLEHDYLADKAFDAAMDYNDELKAYQRTQEAIASN